MSAGEAATMIDDERRTAWLPLAAVGAAQLALAAILAVAVGRRRPALAGLGLALLLAQAWAARGLASLVASSRREARIQADLAAHDGLTGLLNRRALDAGLAALGDRPCAILFVDLDHFKEINDTYRDHTIGDAALRAAALGLRAAVRPGDACARYGGEELCALLPGVTRPADAMLIAERVRAAVAAVRLAEAPGLALTTSVGVAARRPGEPASSLLRRASAAVYAAKGAGRNRVVAADHAEGQTLTGAAGPSAMPRPGPTR
jgi:diguanylate cyclase (GGDEF)-like protein